MEQADHNCVGCCFAGAFAGGAAFVFVGSAIIMIIKIILFPITIPCFIYRRYRYNKWLAEWAEGLNINVRNTVEEYCSGSITYESFRSKISILKIARTLQRHDASYFTKDIETIPMCFHSAADYPLNFMPSKLELFQMLDHFVEKIDAHRASGVVYPNRIIELLIENTKVCPICMDEENPLMLDNSTATHCTHIFHTSCLGVRSDNHRSCPICRMNL